MTENSEQGCENCEFVNRGLGDCDHECFWISDRCPLHNLAVMYRSINGSGMSLEWSTRYTGCRLFKEDLEYKKHNEDVEKLIEGLHAKWKKDP